MYRLDTVYRITLFRVRVRWRSAEEAVEVSWPNILVRQAARRYEDCALSEGVIRVRDDLAVEIKRDRVECIAQRGDVR
jgi:hypothetical protein